MRAGKSLFVFIASIVIIPFAAQNYIAEEACDHQWELYDSSYDYVNETQHKRIEKFYCSNCGEYKTTETLEDHPWEFRYDYYESVNATQHKRVARFYCSDCYEYKTTETLQNHAWKYEYSWNYNDISATQHSYSKEYYCSTCGDYKTETAKSAHKWVLSSKYYNNIKSISSEQHSYTSSYYCDNCYRYKYPSATEKHKFDKYGICQTCDYYKTSTITLKSNSTVNVNENMWMKVKAPKKGLVFLYVKGRSDPIAELYNSKKWRFPDHYYEYDKGKLIIPVSKGTYYLKLYNPGYAAIKYVFKADPSKKNYTKKKAISIKPNKTYTTVIYSGDKKNTWNRYFKIKLTKKQRITILFASDYIYGEVINAKGQYISTSSYYDKNGHRVGFTTDRKLPKGTYYLKISDSWNSVTRKQTTGRYYSFKWK